MRYFVLDDDGQAFGPADVNLLQEWVKEGRILPDTRLRIETTEEIVVASSVGLEFPLPPLASPSVKANYGAYERGQAPAGPKVDYTMSLVWAILSTVLCCLPIGVVAIIYAGKAISESNQGRASEAKLMAEGARNWAMASMVLGLVAGCILGVIGAGN